MTHDGAASNDDPVCAELAGRVAARAAQLGRTIAVAESLTGGRVCAELAAAPQASTWFRGGVVAYADEVKFEVLDVPVGPVVSAGSARAMAVGVARLTGADLAVAITGVGGPAEQEGRAVGTVFLAAHSPTGTTAEEHHLTGDPGDITSVAAALALSLLLRQANDD